MKKACLSISLFFLFISLSCKKADPITSAAKCTTALATDYTKAWTEFAQDPSNTEKCKKAYDILGQLVNCPFVDAKSKAEYQALLKDNPCK
jgi:hypothetical protein